MARFVVAVTGGVASGKSAVTALFEQHGVEVVDADLAARQVVGRGQPALEEIADRFGQGILLSDGTLDRVQMRAIAFEDPRARQDLESITHPRIRMLLRTECLAASSPYAVVAIPLLAEAGAIAAYSWLNRVLVVDAPVAVQHARLMARDGIDSSLAYRMIDAQASRARRLVLATDVLVNDRDLRDLIGPVARLDSLYRRLAKD